MSEHDYKTHALAALAGALGLPLVLIFDLVSSAGVSDWRDLATGGSGLASVLFLALGLLMAYAYLGLRSWLRERLNYRSLDLPILVLIGVTVVFHLGVFAFSLADGVGSGPALVPVFIAFWIGFLVLFGVLDIAIAILLLRDRAQLPGLLTLFAVVSGLLGLVELSVILSPAVLVLLPLLLMVMALCLMYRPDYLEVV